MRQLKMQNNTGRRGGFTLVELMVVLVIASIVSALTLSGFKSLTQSNNRTSCQSNMVQIYQALRLYSADENGGFPLYDAATPSVGIGLWALYTYPNPTNPNGIARPNDGSPIEAYLRHAKSLHCPADDSDADETLLIPDPGNAAQEIYNPNYCSYQSLDTQGVTISTAVQDQATYQPSRSTDKSGCTSNPSCDWKRQLLHNYLDTSVSPNVIRTQSRPPTDDAVVTWCHWHRPASGALDNSRPYDNVLFYDGTVRFLSVTQPGPPIAEGWHREPTSP